MFENDIVSLILICLVAAYALYRTPFFHNRKLFHLSLLQNLYLVVVPGVFFVIVYAYIKSILVRPLTNDVFLSDTVLEPMVYLSFLFSYGGIAIHAVSKMLSETALRHDWSDVAKLNKYFHLTFSHNLIYSGGTLAIVGLTLMEMNHTPNGNHTSLTTPLVEGLVLGSIFIVAMLTYTRSKDQYAGRWADLKAVFIFVWVGLILLLFAAWKNDATLRQYQLAIPVILGVILVAILNTGLIIRRIRREPDTFRERIRQWLGM